MAGGLTFDRRPAYSLPATMDTENPTNRGGRPRTRQGAIRVAIASWREARGLSQGSLAETVGVQQGHLSSWETGYGLPTWQELQRLATALEVTPEHLYSNDMVREIRTAAEVA
jgi:DNA-binding transcriptional regulator YiaG